MNTPYVTDWERRQHEADCGTRAVKAQAIIRLGLILEMDEYSPPPLYMTHDIADSKVYDTFWGVAALPSAGDDAGCAAVDRWARRHRAAAKWDDGRYRAVTDLGGGYRYGITYTPARALSRGLAA